jgi:hypothetical protein
MNSVPTEPGRIGGVEIFQAKTIWLVNFNALDEFGFIHGESLGLFGTPGGYVESEKNPLF